MNIAHTSKMQWTITLSIVLEELPIQPFLQYLWCNTGIDDTPFVIGLSTFFRAPMLLNCSGLGPRITSQITLKCKRFSLVLKWKEYIQIFVGFIISHKANEKRTKNSKYCIDCGKAWPSSPLTSALFFSVLFLIKSLQLE